jgi:hypothetical protein
VRGQARVVAKGGGLTDARLPDREASGGRFHRVPPVYGKGASGPGGQLRDRSVAPGLFKMPNHRPRLSRIPTYTYTYIYIYCMRRRSARQPRLLRTRTRTSVILLFFSLKFFLISFLFSFIRNPNLFYRPRLSPCFSVPPLYFIKLRMSLLPGPLLYIYLLVRSPERAEVSHENEETVKETRRKTGKTTGQNMTCGFAID